MIDCHIIFNEPTDREDWLERCVDSLRHPDVQVHVHRFAESAPVHQRRNEIVRLHDARRWMFFVDPDDYVVEPHYSEFIELLKVTSSDCVWSYEEIKYHNNYKTALRPHHLTAFRGQACAEWLAHENDFSSCQAVAASAECFPRPVYIWSQHQHNTRGVDLKWV